MSCPVKVLPHHVGIFVSDLDRAAAWWEEMFGFKKMFENTFFLPDYGNARMAWIKVGSIYIELYDFPGLSPLDKKRYWKEYGTKHICLYTADDEFDTLVKYLEEKGVTITIRAEHSAEKFTGRGANCKVVFIDDPDGNTIEIEQSFTPGEYK